MLAPLADAHLVELVVTPPPKRRGRRGRPTPTPVGAAAEERDLRVLATANVNSPESLGAVEAAVPRLLVVVAFGQILRDPLLALPPLGALNLHFSLLPRWRGAAPLQRTLLAGDAETGVCVQRMVAALDAGPVLAERATRVGDRETAPELRERLVALGAPLLLEVAQRVLDGRPPSDREQDEDAVTYARKIRREEGDLDFAAEDAAQLDRRVRALCEWPTCRALIHRGGGEAVDVRVLRARPLPAGGPPGTVLSAGADGLLVAAREGSLAITSLKRAGGRALAVRDFLNGCPVQPGDRVLPPP